VAGRLRRLRYCPTLASVAFSSKNWLSLHNEKIFVSQVVLDVGVQCLMEDCIIDNISILLERVMELV
jgi:hypothetical protein